MNDVLAYFPLFGRLVDRDNGSSVDELLFSGLVGGLVLGHLTLMGTGWVTGLFWRAGFNNPSLNPGDLIAVALTSLPWYLIILASIFLIIKVINLADGKPGSKNIIKKINIRAFSVALLIVFLLLFRTIFSVQFADNEFRSALEVDTGYFFAIILVIIGISNFFLYNAVFHYFYQIKELLESDERKKAQQKEAPDDQFDSEQDALQSSLENKRWILSGLLLLVSLNLTFWDSTLQSITSEAALCAGYEMIIYSSESIRDSGRVYSGEDVIPKKVDGYSFLTEAGNWQTNNVRVVAEISDQYVLLHREPPGPDSEERRCDTSYMLIDRNQISVIDSEPND